MNKTIGILAHVDVSIGIWGHIDFSSEMERTIKITNYTISIISPV
ncbi:hypothetical protein [Clostridium sp. DL1XJH146]